MEFPTFIDERGSLSFFEGLKHLPFAMKKIGWTSGAGLGGWTEEENGRLKVPTVVVALKGAAKWEIQETASVKTYKIDRPGVGLFLPKGTETGKAQFSEDALILVVRGAGE